MLVGMQSGTATLGEILAVFLQSNIWSYYIIVLLGIHSPDLKAYVLTKISMSVYSSFTHNLPTLEAIKMPFNR